MLSDTIVALGTPQGTSAIAVVRASGDDVGKLIQDLFGKLPPPRTATRADYRDVSGELLDDVLFTHFPAPKSYTGEDTLEISCHGNPFIAQKLLADLVARGGRLADPGEFTKRAFLNGRLDLSQAEAVMDLIHARSERALAAANRQLRGALGRRTDELIALVVNCLAKIEVYIDFPEEDLPAESRSLLVGQVREVELGTNRLLATSRYGEMLRSGIKTVILGEPNAGKSSLLNRLAGKERALVSPEPGTTRDYLEEFVTVGPHVLRLVDTAGLNDSPTPLERRGIEKTFQQAEGADLFLWVLDGTRPTPSLPEVISGRMTAQNTVVVMNKSDLPAIPHRISQDLEVISASALSGVGFDELEAAIINRAESYRDEVSGDFVAINVRHAAALETARVALGAAREKLERGGPSELIASDLRGVLDALGQIAGKVDNERMLDVLFASFCIGK